MMFVSLKYGPRNQMHCLKAGAKSNVHLKNVFDLLRFVRTHKKEEERFIRSSRVSSTRHHVSNHCLLVS